MPNRTIWLRPRRRALRLDAKIGALMASLAIVGAGLTPIGALTASATTSVANVSAQVSPTTAGAGTATYQVQFTTSSSGSLVGGDEITVTAPDGTALPSYASGYAISSASGTVPVGAVSTAPVAGPGSTAPSTTYNQAVITLGGSNASTPIGDNDGVTLRIYPSGNPIQASTTDHLTVSTSSDVTPEPSTPYTITPGPASSFISPQGDNQSTPTGSAFSQQLGVTIVDAYGNPTPGVQVTFTAPPSTTAQPAASGTFDHPLNSGPCPTSGPSNPPAGNVCVVTADASGKVVASTFTANSNAGNYSVTVTSPGVPTYSLHLTNCSATCPAPPTQVSPGSVTVTPTTAGASGVTYTISFTPRTALPASGGTIKLVAPNGTSFSSTAGDYSISAASGGAVISGVSTTSIGGSDTANQVVLSLLLSTISAGDAVTVRISKSSGSGMTNPTKAGYNYEIQESTSADTLAAYTSTYSITPGNPATVWNVSGDNQSGLIGSAFAAPLVAAVQDQYGNRVGGAQVTFKTPTGGPSAAWTNGTNVETDTTTATGEAESSVPVANSVAGSYPVSAAANAVYSATGSTFNLTNVAQPVSPSTPTLTSSAAGDQDVAYSLTFTTSSTGSLASGATITVMAPPGTAFTSSNASDYLVTVSDGHSATVGSVTLSSAGGSSTNNQVVMTLESSSIAPTETVTVKIDGVTNPTAASNEYYLTEVTSSDTVPAATPDYSITAANPASVSVVSGSYQNAEIGERFASPLVALVQDAYGNPVAGAQVTFSSPASGPGVLFANNTSSESDPTNASGLATSSIPVANGSGGTYSISTTVVALGVASNPSFTLTNTAPAWSGWVGPETLPPPGLAPDTAPAVTSWQSGRLDLFVEGGDASLWHRWSTDGGASWSNWENLGGVLAGSPAAVSWGFNRIDVFVRGTDNQLWHKWWDGSSWHGWEPLGGVLASTPAVSSWSAGRLDVFVQGTDGAIWHKWWDNGWYGWESRGGLGRYAPGAVSSCPNHIDLFTVGTDGHMWHQVWNGSSWTGWFTDVNLTFSSGPALSSWGPGRLDLFAAAAMPGNPMFHLWFDGSWHAESLGGQLGSAPGVVSWGPQRIDTFVQGPDHNLWYQWYGI